MVHKMEVSNANIQVRPVALTDEDYGRIPDNLADATYTIFGLHKANGDLAWVADILSGFEDGDAGLDGVLAELMDPTAPVTGATECEDERKRAYDLVLELQNSPDKSIHVGELLQRWNLLP